MKQVTASANALHSITNFSENITAFTTLRNHPEGNVGDNNAFSAFNLGLHVNDNAVSVRKNRQLLLNYLPKNTQIQWLEQVHGADVAVATEHNETPVVADAIYTQQANLALAIMTADCLPILLSDDQGKEIAAIHGGWRPLADNIIANTLAKFNAKPCHVNAWLGPCISNAHFDVGADVYQRFVQSNDQALAKAFTQHNVKPNHYFANLTQIATLQLTRLGVNNIDEYSPCTFSNSDKFYSYRRDKITGRMASLICLT